jgi:hypothetical protein
VVGRSPEQSEGHDGAESGSGFKLGASFGEWRGRSAESSFVTAALDLTFLPRIRSRMLSTDAPSAGRFHDLTMLSEQLVLLIKMKT